MTASPLGHGVLRVVVLHDAVGPAPRPDELDTLRQAEEISRLLAELGHDPRPLACLPDLGGVMADLQAMAPHLVFNLVESWNNSGRLAHMAPALLDGLGIPYTGSSTLSLCLTADKPATKRLLALGGLPTPGWRTMEDLDREDLAATGKYLIKPCHEHASLGLDAESLVEVANASQLRAALKSRQRETGLACFAERFIPGREFAVALLARDGSMEPLPVSEIQFRDFPAHAPHIVGFRAKWDERSLEYARTVRSFEINKAEPDLAALLARLAKRCCTLFDGSGYLRVDLRMKEDAGGQGRPFIIDVNANPCLTSDAGFMAAAAQAGIAPAQVAERILEHSLLRAWRRAAPQASLAESCL